MLTGTCHCGTLQWTFDGVPESVTACNCTLCRRYGVLWIYDYEGERIKISGPSAVYTRNDKTKPVLEVHFCGGCGCVGDASEGGCGGGRVVSSLTKNLKFDRFCGLHRGSAKRFCTLAVQPWNTNKKRARNSPLTD